MGIRRLRRRAALGASVVALLALAGCFEDLGAPPNVNQLTVTDVNASGTLVLSGRYTGQFPEAGLRGYVVKPDGEYVLLGGGEGSTTPTVDPKAINDAGSVVGNATTGAFVWDEAAGLRPLADLVGVAHDTATDISDTGIVVGVDTDDPSPQRAWLWNPADGHHDLAPQDGFPRSQVTAVNDDGVAVGTSVSTDASTSRATLWAPPDYQPLDLTPAGAERGEATDIADDGTAVGQLAVDGTGYAARWAPGNEYVYELMDENSRAEGIADDGTIVGNKGTPRRPVTWDPETLTPMPLSGPEFVDPEAQFYAAAVEGQYIAGGYQLYIWYGGGQYSAEAKVFRWAR